MINLLPPELREARRYAHRNRILLRWLSVGVVSIAFFSIIVLIGYWTIAQSSKVADDSRQRLEQLLVELDVASTRRDYESYSANAKLFTQILNRQVLFSELVQQIGAVTPDGMTLNNMALSDTDNAIALDFKSARPELAQTLIVNLTDQTRGIFSSADLLSLSCPVDTTGATTSCNVQIKAQYRDNASFLFLNRMRQR